MRWNRTAGDVETARDRSALAEDAGMGSVSIASVFAGTLVAFGATVLLLAMAAAVASGVGLDTELQASDWRDAGLAGGAILAGVLLVSYLFGGYAAGRMARRHGLMHGGLVFVTSLVAVGVATVVARLLTDADADTILRNLRSVGVPTTGSEWREVVTVAGIGSLAAMLLGSVFGGILGDRWHTKLVARALHPNFGPEGDLRREADAAHEAAATRVERTRVAGGVDLRDRHDETVDDTVVDNERDDETVDAGRGGFFRRSR